MSFIIILTLASGWESTPTAIALACSNLAASDFISFLSAFKNYSVSKRGTDYFNNVPMVRPLQRTTVYHYRKKKRLIVRVSSGV